MKKHTNVKTNKNFTGKLIAFREPKAPASEAYRALRTNIDFSGFDKVIKTLLVTSATPDEGKSVVTGNLGITMAVDGKKVLIIDADLRNPSQHKCFGLSNNVGLTSLLVNDSLCLEEAICTTNIHNLFILPGGPIPPNPAELLNSKKMRELIQDLACAFDIILVDSPPVMAVTDASILASYLDGTILVIGTGQVSKELAHAAKEQLNKVKANILGAVLNKAPLSSGGYYSNYYYGRSS